MDVAGEEKRK